MMESVFSDMRYRVGEGRKSHVQCRGAWSSCPGGRAFIHKRMGPAYCAQAAVALESLTNRVSPGLMGNSLACAILTGPHSPMGWMSGVAISWYITLHHPALLHDVKVAAYNGTASTMHMTCISCMPRDSL